MKKLTGYNFLIGKNGRRLVNPDSVPGVEIGVSLENSKLGPCINYGLEIEYTCRHDCECYSVIDPETGKPGKGLCYGQCGFFMMGSNLAIAANNYKFVRTHSDDEILAEFQRHIDLHPEIKYFRHFEIGDIPYMEYVGIMCRLAANNPGMIFWCYTKKYALVNAYFDKYGIDSKPENLTIILALSLFLWDEPFLTVSEVLCPGPPQVPSALRASVLPGGPWEHRRGAHGLGTALSIRSSCTDFWMHP